MGFLDADVLHLGGVEKTVVVKVEAAASASALLCGRAELWLQRW